MKHEPANTETLREWCSILRKHCAPLLPVVVRRRRLADDEPAYTKLRYDEHDSPSHFLIVLDPRMTRYEAQITLCHEWAHCLDWTEGTAGDLCKDHPASYWLRHGTVYDALVGGEHGG